VADRSASVGDPGSRRPGPVYDSAVKALCALNPSSLCAWLGLEVSGRVEIVHHSESVPPMTRQVDALLVIGSTVAVHIEFQRAGEAGFAMRMLDYWVRLRRLPALAGRVLVQHVVVLGGGTVEDGIREHGVTFTYTVHYLRDQPPESLLADPYLCPFAALADVNQADRPAVLRQALDLIAAVADEPTRTVLARAAVDLAAIRLTPDIINLTWEDSAMPIPSLLQTTFDDGLEKGLEKGRYEVVATLLRHRFGDDPRVDEIAHRIATDDPDVALDRIDAATTLDEL
jgi:hypothetical protein